MYRNGRHGFQHNGRVVNLIVENDIIHSNDLGGISLLMGVSSSTFRNNLIFNNNKQGIIFYLYDSGNPDIKPYDQVNNLFINNLIWIGKYKWDGSGTEPSLHKAVLFSDDTTAQTRSMDGNVFRNNIFVTYNGAIFKFSQQRFANTTTIENNIVYRVGGPDKVMTYGGDTYDFNAFQNFSDLIKNNLLADPKFTDVSIDYNLNPEKFNFDYLSDSPAIDFGIDTDAPSTDLRGNQRIGNPDAGCYEYYPRDLTILTSSIPSGVVNETYSQELIAYGGSPPYNWSLISGSLPEGLFLSGSIIEGTPLKPETANFTIQVEDSAGNKTVKNFTITIVDEGFYFITNFMLDAEVGVEYHIGIEVSGGVKPYNFTLISGFLPDNLSLNSSSGEISGIPLQNGTFTFTVLVKDSSGKNATEEFTLVVNPGKCIYGADKNCDGKVDNMEVAEFIQEWFSGYVGLKDLIKALEVWKNG